MAIAYHITFGAYGFWLPNDPRGSWSDYVYASRLQQFGPATKVTTNRSVAYLSHDHSLRQRAKKALIYPSVVFAGMQVLAVGNGFAQVIQQVPYKVFACAIMPEHIHLVTAIHATRSVGRIVQHFKSGATQQLRKEGIHPFEKENHSPWAEGYWSVYLDTEDEVFNAIEYVHNNPIREGLDPQNWPFVVPVR